VHFKSCVLYFYVYMHEYAKIRTPCKRGDFTILPRVISCETVFRGPRVSCEAVFPRFPYTPRSSAGATRHRLKENPGGPAHYFVRVFITRSVFFLFVELNWLAGRELGLGVRRPEFELWPSTICQAVYESERILILSKFKLNKL
jgi:hypothetical protein